MLVITHSDPNHTNSSFSSSITSTSTSIATSIATPTSSIIVTSISRKDPSSISSTIIQISRLIREISSSLSPLSFCWCGVNTVPHTD